MRRPVRALLRLFAVQGAWSYDRMLGIGMAYAAEPLLEELRATDPDRFREATGRSAEFFNCHPYLAGVALGALARAERDGAPAAQVSRLRAALCGPLGALGDQLFWAGVVPALVALTLALVALDAGWPAIVAFLVAFNAVRLATGRWALRTGLKNGLQVARAIHGSWLPRAISRVSPLAGALVGVAVPLAAAWLLQGTPTPAMLLVVSGAAIVTGLSWQVGAWLTPIRVTLFAMGAALLWQWGFQ